MALYEALYGRKYRSPVHWDEAEERTYLGQKLVEQSTEAIKKIRQPMKIAQSRQKSYADSGEQSILENVSSQRNHEI